MTSNGRETGAIEMDVRPEIVATTALPPMKANVQGIAIASAWRARFIGTRWPLGCTRLVYAGVASGAARCRCSATSAPVARLQDLGWHRWGGSYHRRARAPLARLARRARGRSGATGHKYVLRPSVDLPVAYHILAATSRPARRRAGPGDQIIYALVDGRAALFAG
jgi:hypothetical protein